MAIDRTYLGVGHSVAHNVLQENFQDAPSLFVDQSADALHAAASRQSSNGGLGDAGDGLAN